MTTARSSSEVGRYAATALLTVFVLAAGEQVAAQCAPVETLKILASDATSDLSFGLGIAIDGDVAAVGAPQDDSGGVDAGAVYVYRFDGTTWNEEAKIVASDSAPDDQFGTAVALDGDTMLVGAWWDDDGGSASGSAYVFRYDGAHWLEEQKLTASDAAPNAWFAYRVDLSGDLAICGAWGDGAAGVFAGAAYIYRFDGTSWNQEIKLNASDAAIVDYFGFSVSIDGDVAAVGSVFADAGAPDAGAVYVYRYDGDTWTEEAQLLADDAAQNDQLGTSVIVRGDSVFSGSFGDDNGAGAVYVFEKSGSVWTQVDKLVSADRWPGDGFGWSTSLDGDSLLISADTDDDDGNSSGSAYLFRYDGVAWGQDSKWTASDADADDNFAYAVALSGNHAIIGAPDNEDFGEMTGSAYVFDLNCPLLGDVDGDGDVDLADLSLLLSAYGSCDGDPGFNPAADIDDSGCVDLTDLAGLLANYGS